MPSSQLKRLKASLREQGITGPQKSKKQRKNASKPEQRTKRDAALANIRESLNPFEVKAPTRPKKHEVTSTKALSGKRTKGEIGRPGVTKSMGEEARRKTLLLEMQQRNKVGGVYDRRIGENDPTMTPEQKMFERFAREKQGRKRSSIFDLEDEEEEVLLTHGGRTLTLDDDDFDAGSLQGLSEDEQDGLNARKRKRELVGSDGEMVGTDEPEQPERKKSKAEVMKEVIAKSKLYKYERQQAKEEDQEIREELDKETTDIFAALRGLKDTRLVSPPPVAAPSNGDFFMNPARAALMAAEDPDKEYDSWLRQIKLDKRAQPTERTKTEEESAKEEAERLRMLEEQRLRRMQGEEESDAEDNVQQEASSDKQEGSSEVDDAAEFGFKVSSAQKGSRPAGVEDEDDFLVDDDLVASASDPELASDDGDESGMGVQDEEDDEFVADLLSKEELKRPEFQESSSSKVPFTYSCPRTHKELLGIVEEVAFTELPTIVQRIRALYHPQLHSDNKAKLADFACALVDHIAYMVNHNTSPPLSTVENLIRHIHSLSKTFPEAIAKTFRAHLRRWNERQTANAGDLVILTAIGTIYPTSDHFHQVVTPAITLMARWLGITNPLDSQDFITGAYIGKLCIRYQRLSKRYIPELVRFTNLALKSGQAGPVLEAHLNNLNAMMDLWISKSASIEIFQPETLTILQSLDHPISTKLCTRLKLLISQAALRKRPLELHRHRPLPIKTAVPKFEENFNPDKHYDPDMERREAAKLRTEYKRERKGALRELRKDANFIARQKLREKRERDAAYEAKYKRLVAEIQGEEGREKNAYEREKRLRKGKR